MLNQVAFLFQTPENSKSHFLSIERRKNRGGKEAGKKFNIDKLTTIKFSLNRAAS